MQAHCKRAASLWHLRGRLSILDPQRESLRDPGILDSAPLEDKRALGRDNRRLPARGYQEEARIAIKVDSKIHRAQDPAARREGHTRLSEIV